MLRQVLLGSSLLIATTIVHTLCTVIAMRSLKVARLGPWSPGSLTWGAMFTGGSSS